MSVACHETTTAARHAVSILPAGAGTYFATKIRRKMRHKSICIPFVHDKAR
nr:MAG TPA: hypothetical protein [Caudoviricetes sp.]